MDKPDSRLLLKILVGTIVAVLVFALSAQITNNVDVRYLAALLLGVLAFIYLV